MNGFPQARLREVRALRTDRAEREHAARLRELEGARTRLAQQCEALQRLVDSRDREKLRLSSGLPRPADICRTVSYIEALDDRIASQNERVAHLRDAVAGAEEAVHHTAKALALARRRQDTLDEQARHWSSQRRQQVIAAEEEAAHELYSRNPHGGRR